jgi:hypothetical protein
MKRLLPLLLRSLVLLPAVLLAAGCHLDHLTDDDSSDHGHGNGHHGDVTRTYGESDFDEIEIHSAIQLTVRQSQTYRVEVTVSRDAEDDVEVRREGNRLRISLQHGFLDGEARAVVELPVLARVAAHDASHVRLESFSSPAQIEVHVRGGSEIDGDLKVQRLIVDLADASRATLSGSTDELRLKASAISEAHLRDLASRRADVELHSASNATIRVSEWLDVTASGLSVLHYYGDPHRGRDDLSSGARVEHEH